MGKNYSRIIVIIIAIIVLVLALTGVFSKKEESRRKLNRESWYKTLDCTQNLVCKNSRYSPSPENPSPNNLGFGQTCSQNSDCKNNSCNQEYKKCLSKPVLNFRPLDCGYKDTTQGYYTDDTESKNYFCRNVGDSNDKKFLCTNDGTSANQYTSVNNLKSGEHKIPLIPSDQCFNGSILR